MWFFCVLKWSTFGFLGMYLRYYLNSPQVLPQLKLWSTFPKPWAFLCDPQTMPLCGSLVSSSGPPLVFWDCTLGTTLIAFKYYFKGPQVLPQIKLKFTFPKPRTFLCDPKTLPLCGSLVSSSGPPLVCWDCTLGTTLRALRYYLNSPQVLP